MGWGQLVLVLSGSLDVSIRGALWQFRAGRGFWIPSDAWDSAKAWRETRVLSLGCGEAFYAEPRLIECSAFLRELLDRMAALGTLCDEVGLSFLRVVKHELELTWSLALTPRWPRTYWGDLAATALSRVGPSEASVLSIADEFDMSRRTFDRRFFQETGMGPSEWRREARLCESIRLLSMGMQVGAVGQMVGCTQVAYLEAFYHKFGTTPGRFMRVFRGDLL